MKTGNKEEDELTRQEMKLVDREWFSRGWENSLGSWFQSRGDAKPWFSRLLWHPAWDTIHRHIFTYSLSPDPHARSISSNKRYRASVDDRVERKLSYAHYVDREVVRGKEVYILYAHQFYSYIRK